MNENKLPTKEDLEKHTADLGELMAEIVATYKRIKSMANPMAKSFKPVVMKPHGIKDVLVVQLPEHLDKKEKNVSWFLRLLVTHYPEVRCFYRWITNRLT